MVGRLGESAMARLSRCPSSQVTAHLVFAWVGRHATRVDVAADEMVTFRVDHPFHAICEMFRNRDSAMRMQRV
jgi:hypothetical protein